MSETRFIHSVPSLLKGWLVSFLAFGFVASVISVQFVLVAHGSLEGALRSSVRDWVPWIVLTPLLFRFVDRVPLGRRKMRTRLALHLAVALGVLLLTQGWRELVDPRFRAGPGGCTGPTRATLWRWTSAVSASAAISSAAPRETAARASLLHRHGAYRHLPLAGLPHDHQCCTRRLVLPARS